MSPSLTQPTQALQSQLSLGRQTFFPGYAFPFSPSSAYYNDFCSVCGHLSNCACQDREFAKHRCDHWPANFQILICHHAGSSTVDKAQGLTSKPSQQDGGRPPYANSIHHLPRTGEPAWQWRGVPPRPTPHKAGAAGGGHPPKTRRDAHAEAQLWQCVHGGGRRKAVRKRRVHSQGWSLAVRNGRVAPGRQICASLYPKPLFLRYHSPCRSGKSWKEVLASQKIRCNLL